MNEEQKEWKPLTMKEMEEQMLGIKPKKEETEQSIKETKEQRLEKLKAQAKVKRQELDDIYKEMENTI